MNLPIAYHPIKASAISGLQSLADLLRDLRSIKTNQDSVHEVQRISFSYHDQSPGTSQSRQ